MIKSALQEKNIHQTHLRRLVFEAVQEVLSDPDFGMELSEVAKKRLRRAAKARTTVPFSEIKRKYL